MDINWPRIGALWQKDKQDGASVVTTFSGKVTVPAGAKPGDEIPVFVRGNRFAEADKASGKNSPDWHIFQMPPRER